MHSHFSANAEYQRFLQLHLLPSNGKLIFFILVAYENSQSSAKRSLTSLLIVSRHSKLVTLNDTAYQVECQFSDGTVQAQLTVK